MRTLLAGELTAALTWTGADYYGKLEIQNGSGTWINLATYFNGIINAQWGEHVNDPVAHATFTLIRNVGGNSFAPFLEASPVNVDDVAAYSPLLELGRGIRWSTATMGQGVTLDTGKYRQVFIGRIDRVKQTDGVGATPIVIECSDLGAWLMDSQIHDGVTRYGDEDGGTPEEDVIQAILDDKIPAGEPSVTLVKQSSSNFAVTGFDLEEVKIFQGLLDLVLNSVGEDLRYRYDASHVSQFTWFNPDRSRVTTDATITTYTLRRLDTEIDDIRNAGELPFVDSATGVADVVFSDDVASLAKYRERYQRMGESPLLTDSTSAQATLDAVINDLSGPIAEFEAICPYLWFVQLFDRYVFPADGRTYDADQTLGVVGVQHTLENGTGSTAIQCAGRVVGAYAEWLKRIPDNSTLPTLDIEVPPLLSYTVRVEDTGDDSTAYLTAKVQGGPGTYLTRAQARIDREPTEEEIDDSTPSAAGQRSGVFTDIAELEAGRRFYVAGRAYDANGNGTAIARISEVWLGLDSTPGADITIGTIVSLTDKIIYAVAFDNECAYCEVWIREFTDEPDDTYSVENLTPHPFRVLTLGADAMVPGVEFDLEIPIAGPDNWLMTTFVPFDHLGKRGNVKTRLTQGSRGVLTGGGLNPRDIFGADLVLWWDPTQETAYADGEELDVVTDFGVRGNDGTADHFTEGVYSAVGNATWEDALENGLPVFHFQYDPAVFNNLKQWVDSPECINPTADGAFLMFVCRRYPTGVHREHDIFVNFQSSGGAVDYAQVKETNNEGPSSDWIDRIKWERDASVTPVIIADSLTTDLFVYGIRFASASEALQWFNGVEDANGTFDPNSDADGLRFIRIGQGYFNYGDIVLAEGNPTDEQVQAAFEYAMNKWAAGGGGGGVGTPPDPPADAEQIDQTVTSITVRVTMPAVAPDSIRISVGSTRVYDEAVSVAGGATQDFEITGLVANSAYPLGFRSVEDGLVSSEISITGATAIGDGSQLDAPTTDPDPAVYSRGDQNIVVRLSAGANNPLGFASRYEVEASLTSGGSFSFIGSAPRPESGDVIVLCPYAQPHGASRTLYLRARVLSPTADYSPSDYTAEFTVVVPGQ